MKSRIMPNRAKPNQTIPSQDKAGKVKPSPIRPYPGFIGAIFLKFEVLQLLRMHFKRYKFGYILSVIKGTLFVEKYLFVCNQPTIPWTLHIISSSQALRPLPLWLWSGTLLGE
jgi:hypothetical protein